MHNKAPSKTGFPSSEMNSPNTFTSSMTSPTSVSDAFGRLAASYDEDFENLPASRRLRSIIWNVYLQYFNVGDSLLELNCGTGTDALALASNGMKIHATDISSGMLAAFHQKLSRSATKELITVQRLAFDQLSTLRGRSYDGIYSNMGGLNCEGDMQRVADDLHTLIKPGGIFIGTFLGTSAVWEMLAFAIRGKMKQAMRRRNPLGCEANVGGSIVRTFYYSPDLIQKYFSPHFVSVELVGLNIFTPPPTSQGAYRALGKMMHALERLDDIVMRLFPFNKIGDHFIIVLKHIG